MTKAVTLLLAAAFLPAIAAAPARAQSAMPPMPGMHTFAPPDQLPAPIRMSGIGNSHIAIKATPEAQIWFDQGLTLLHDFWDYESAKAFEQAVRVDPKCAMCYWGLARAMTFRGEEDKIYADQALQQAVKLERRASATDRLYIDAALAESREDNATNDDHTQSIALYRKLVRKEPRDPEARIFLATTLEDGFDDKNEPKPGEKEAIAILESILRDAPNDSAANHYWIHAMEPSNHPERAIPSAALLASLAPTSGHMVHMPGHIYYRVGDYSSADRWFTASTEADERYLRDQHVSVDDDWNYVHNMMYAIANQMEQGRLTAANALSDHLAAAHGQLAASLYIWSARDQMSRVSLRLPVALRIGDWPTVLTLVDAANLPDKDNTANLRFLRDELRSLATGMQALDRGDPAAAKTASTQFDAGLWRQQQDANAAAEAKKKSDADKDKDKDKDKTRTKTRSPTPTQPQRNRPPRPSIPTPSPTRSSKPSPSLRSNSAPASSSQTRNRTPQRSSTPKPSPPRRSSATTSRPSTSAPSPKPKPKRSSAPKITPEPAPPTRPPSPSARSPASSSTASPTPTS